MDDPVVDVLIRLNYAERQIQRIRELVCRLAGIDLRMLERRRS